MYPHRISIMKSQKINKYYAVMSKMYYMLDKIQEKLV